MDDYSEETYGERIADVYDQWYSEFDPSAIQTLPELAQGERSLELGIGTGRIAVPLLKTGLSVHGIDASESMVAKLRAKPGGDRIPIKMGNFVEVSIEGQFTLIYVVFNTFYSLLTQEEQIRCFQNVARHLTSDGVFVIEAFVPDLKRFTGGQAIRLNRIEVNEVQIDVSQIEPDAQIVTSQHIVLTELGRAFTR